MFVDQDGVRRRGRDLTGETFGKWKVSRLARSTKHGKYWECICCCEKRTVREIRTHNLIRSKSHSCGCLRKQRVPSLRQRFPKEYTAWRSAKTRCYNPNYVSFHRYGRRGITMCETWRNSFAAFLQDLGECSPGYSLHRIDGDGNYEPGNCIWASPAVQARSKVSNRYLEFAGERLILTDWAKKLNMSVAQLNAKLAKGFTIADLMVPIELLQAASALPLGELNWN